MIYARVPLQQREVTIIRNMKKKLKLPVTKIAAAVERSKETVYKALDPSWKFNKRGRPEALTKAIEQVEREPRNKFFHRPESNRQRQPSARAAPRRRARGRAAQRRSY